MSHRTWRYTEEDALRELAESYTGMHSTADLRREESLIEAEMAIALESDRWLYRKQLALCHAELARRSAEG